MTGDLLGVESGKAARKVAREESADLASRVPGLMGIVDF